MRVHAQLLALGHGPVLLLAQSWWEVYVVRHPVLLLHHVVLHAVLLLHHRVLYAVHRVA
jgi:hypothetical protein